MGDGHRAATSDLLTEYLHYAAPAVQHVAEPHGCAEERRCAGAEVIIISQIRFVAPMTLVGLTALSVEISMK